MWKRVKLSGNIAMLVVGMWQHVIDAAWESNGETCQDDATLRSLLHRVWQSWERVVYAITALKPAEDQVWGLRPDVARLLVALQRALPDTAWSGYYFHTLLHATDYMDHYRGLGIFANQGAEAKHREGALAYIKGGSGGTQGRHQQAAERRP